MKPLIIAAPIVPALLLVCAPIAVPAQTNNPGAISFDGASGLVQMPSGVWFNGDFTIEGWVYVRSYQSWSRLIDFADGPNNYNVYLALTDNTSGLPTAGVFLSNNGSPLFSATNQLPLNQWVHLAETAHGTNGTIYINGNVVGSGVLNIAPNVVRANNYVGRSAYSSDQYADAIFDELRIWNVARNQFQLQTFRSQPLLGPQTNLVGYWKFDDNTGTQASDSSGNNNPGSLQGGTTWTNFTAPISPGFGTALNFNGTLQDVQIPNQASLNAFPLTVMAWFNTPTNNLRGGLVNKYTTTSFNGYQIFMENGHLQAWYFRDSGDNVFGPLDAGLVNDGKWHHTAFVVDTNGGRLYLDGVLKSSLPWTGTPGPTTTTDGIDLGFYQGEMFFNGQLDEVSLWNTNLSLAQIRSAAIQGLAGTETNLLAYYRLDEGSGNFTADSSTNHFNGTLVSSPTWVASLSPPTYSAQTISATPFSSTSELLTGGVVPLGLDTTAWFQFGTTTSYGSVTAPTNWTDGFIPQRIVSLVATGLLLDTDYHYQMVCSNSAGIRMGADQVFHSARNVSVTSLIDSGASSLRQALATAQNFDTIYLTNGTIVLTNGDLMVSNVTVSIVGISPSASVISGNNKSRTFNIASNGNLSLSFMTIQGGIAPGVAANGGGIYNSGTLTIDHCIITNNQAGAGSAGGTGANGGGGGSGGGIWNGGTLLVSKSTLVNNSAGTGGAGGPGATGALGGGTAGGNGGGGGSGGAIMNVGTATLNECTIFTNISGNGGPGGADNGVGYAPGNGGSAGGGGAVFNDGTLMVIASTLCQNAGGNGGPGGGSMIGNGSGGGGGSGGGIHTVNGISATLQDTVVAQNSAAAFSDLNGAFNSSGHNFIGRNDSVIGFTNGINGDLTGSNAAPLNPQLTPLGNYGGVTPTCELLPGSPLKDAGDDGLLNPPWSLTTDQRDLPRLVGSHVDIGAVESSIVWPTPTAVTLPVTPTQDPIYGNWSATLQGSVNPGGLQTTVYFQFGISAGYGGIAPAGVLPVLDITNNLVSAVITNLTDSRTYHYRVVATNSAGIFVGNDTLMQTYVTPPVPGDINGDGIVDSSELAIVISHLHSNGVALPQDIDLILSNYWSHAPGIMLTNVSGLGAPVVTFQLTNFDGGNFDVDYSSNLTDWVPVGRTTQLFQFTDTNAPAGERYYRLRFP